MHTTSKISAIALCLISLTACDKAPQYDAQGTFQAIEVIVSAEGNGKILSLNIEEGDSLVALQKVGLIDTLQLHLQKLQLRQQHSATLSAMPNIQSQLAAIRAQIQGTTADRDRIARLLVDGAATQKQLDDANTRLTTLKAELNAAQSSLNNNKSTLTDQAAAIAEQIAAIDDRIARSYISAPISGIVVNKLAQSGEVTAYGKPLFKIADTGHMYLRAYFTSDQLSDLEIGQKVTVVANYGADVTKSYNGEIIYISPTSEFTPKTIQTKDSRANLVYAVKIAVPNDGLLKIGLTGDVYVDADNQRK